MCHLLCLLLLLPGPTPGDDALDRQGVRRPYVELLRSDDMQTREQARIRLYEIDRPEAIERARPASTAVSEWSGFGEGFSSPADGATIEISPRAHTAPSLTEWSNRGLVVERLEVAPRMLEVRAGAPLNLRQLQVFALDPNGRVIEGVPLSFSIEGSDRIFDFEGYRNYGTEILTTGPGEATIWVESLLPNQHGSRVREGIRVAVYFNPGAIPR